ncbi:MAG TPA: porin [Pirellulales bacterium]|jgi:phosphate-selective porin OprO/OprP|nr:porin [Pirellulales bacterium]
MRDGSRVGGAFAPRATANWVFAIGVLVGGVSVATTQAQDINSPPFDDLKRMVEQQQQQLRQMQDQLARLQQGAPAQPSDGTVQVPAIPVNAESAAMGAPAAIPADQPYVVGSDLSVKSDFRNGLFLNFATPNNDFNMHIGGWMQLDNVWWNQSPALKAAPGARPGPVPQGVANGVALGGIGDLEDGEYFRRIRLFFEGNFWENGEYRLIPAFENDQFSTVGLDEFWVGATSLPVVGTVHIGHVKNAIGLEGDMSSSSRCMTFMERSAYSEAIELNQNFVTGIQLSDNYLDQRVTWQAVAFRPDNGSSSGVFFGDGQSGVQARLTALPVYENEGRDLLHFGVSGGFRDGTTNNATSPFHVFQLRARPELRDDDPAAGGPGAVPNADSNRLIDTGAITAHDEFLLGLENLWIRGPFSFQAEYGWNFLNGAIGANPGLTAPFFHPAIAPAQNYTFSGGYLQVAYTLTGENRSYDRRFGTLDRYYYGKAGPYSNAWMIRDEDGHLHCGCGAWEVAARYSYVNLNDGTGLNKIQGGVLNGVSLALNWYANDNFNVMLDWVYDQRDDTPTGPTLATSSPAGWTSGVGIEAQFQF